MLSIFLSLISYGGIAADYNDCGSRYALNNFEPAISFGGKTLRSEFPWHVALYRQDSNDGSAEYICGGSILHPKVILTAAHCVYNETYSEIENATFTIVAGKYYVSLEHTDPGEQRLKVINIKIPKTYVGFKNRYAEDIALLELNTTINFTSAIMPVCIDWNSEYLVEQLPTVGTVVGWGRTENNTMSDELLMANLKYIEFTKCRERITSGFSFFVTSDKFCAGLDNGTAVQRGDSGGGITYLINTTNNKQQYYLFGIVSIKDIARSNIAAFTDIRKHLNWLNVTLLSIIDPGLFEVGCPPNPSNSVSLTLCNLNGTSVNCNRNAKLGTKAKLHCKSSYYVGSPFKLYAETECSAGLKWLPLPQSCLVCGKRYRFNRIIPLVKYKRRTVSEFPWHVALYKKDSFLDPSFICGGTIIHPKAVITAAHCVYKENVHKLRNESDILVAAGKFNSSWMYIESEEQRFQVKKIHIKNTFRGQMNSYKDDIAVLELNITIDLSDYIMPVCLDWGENLNLYGNPLILGTIGFVVISHTKKYQQFMRRPVHRETYTSDVLNCTLLAVNYNKYLFKKNIHQFQAPGWGYTEEDTISVELRASKLLYSNAVQCLKLVEMNFKKFIGSDKFCAISVDGTIPDRGDSGGSLTFPYYNRETGEELNYLYGIVSTKPKSSDDLIIFTNVTYHLKWIKIVLISIINKNSS